MKSRVFFLLPVLCIVILGQSSSVPRRTPTQLTGSYRMAASSPQTSSIFAPAVQYDSGGRGSTSVVVADVNGDGKPDLIVANECDYVHGACNNGSAAVLINSGDGTFKPPVAYATGGNRTQSLAV